MFNPRRWKWDGAKTAPAYGIVDEDGTKIAEVVSSFADANLIRCAPDAHEFLVKLLDAGRVVPPHLREEAERIRHRMEGLRS